MDTEEFTKNVERMFRGNTPDRKQMVELTDRDIGDIACCIGVVGGIVHLPSENQSEFLNACCEGIPHPDARQAFLVAMLYCVEHMKELGELLERIGGLGDES